MMVARRARDAVAFGVAAAVVIGLGLVVELTSYEVWGAVLIVPILATLTLLALRFVLRRELRAAEPRLEELREGLALRQVARVLKLYATALSGRDVAVRGIDEMETVDRFGPDHIILPADMRFFQDDDRNFTAYKVAAAHGAARIEFGTYRFQLDDVPETIAARVSRTWCFVCSCASGGSARPARAGALLPAAVGALRRHRLRPLETGEFDRVAVGDTRLVDPQWVGKVRDALERAPRAIRHERGRTGLLRAP